MHTTLRILIADDDDGDRMKLLRALRQAALPFECMQAASIEEAVELCDRETFDCAILDYLLPGQDGLYGISQLHDKCPTMAILMVTGQGDVSVATEAMKRGASDYMPKITITAESIRRAVENAMEKASLQSTVARQQEELIRLAAERHAAELAKQQERAAEADRVKTRALELRDEFLSHVSHELRAPLAAIASFASIIADGLAGETTSEQLEYLSIIQKNAKQLESMIEDLLAVRASQTGKLRVEPQRTSLAQAILDAVNTCESKAKAKGVALRSDVPTELAPALADPIRLVQLLIILSDNAVKFTQAGGSVTVSARVSEHDDGFLIAQVSDTGCGIRPDQASRVFDQLYQVEETSVSGRKGLGLGLHIARQLVIQQGGRIWVESVLGQGSRFSFTVPVFAGNRAAEAA